MAIHFCKEPTKTEFTNGTIMQFQQTIVLYQYSNGDYVLVLDNGTVITKTNGKMTEELPRASKVYSSETSIVFEYEPIGTNHIVEMELKENGTRILTDIHRKTKTILADGGWF